MINFLCGHSREKCETGCVHVGDCGGSIRAMA